MITSTSNAQIKNLIQLQKKAKARTEQNVFVAEGIKMVQEAPKELIQKIYISEDFAGNLKGQENVQLVESRVFKSAADTKTPQGILAVIKRQHYTLEQVTKGAAPLLLLLENIQDPGNLGTIIRTAEGAGVTGIIMSTDTVDIYNPKTIRSTMGSIYRMPFIYEPDLTKIISELKERGITFYAAHLKNSTDYDQQDYQKSSAFMIGNEGSGLTDEVAEMADKYVKIPMCGQVESLNAAVASSILVYEAFRQRRK